MPMKSDNILLKVCPRCSSVYSRYDTNCRRCASMAKTITDKIPDLRRRWSLGEELTDHEQALLAHVPDFLARAGLDEDAFLAQEPFALPDELQGVGPSFKNRLLFFMDRMRSEDRKVTPTSAATNFLNKVEQLLTGSKGTMNGRDFADFALKHGIRPLMSADAEMQFAAWDHDDVMELWKQYQAERATVAETEKEPGQGLVTSLQAAVLAGMPSAKTFADFAKKHGVEPARAFGDLPEQVAWRKEDIEALARAWKLESEITMTEERIARLERTVKELDQPPVKWPAMQRMREHAKEIESLRVHLQKLRGQHSAPAPKTSSDNRLERILSLA